MHYFFLQYCSNLLCSMFCHISWTICKISSLTCYLGLRRIKIATDCISSTFLGYKVSINSKDIREIGRNREFIYFSTVTLTERQRKNADLFFFLHPKKIIYLNERKEMLPFIYSVCKRQGIQVIEIKTNL